MKSSTAVIVARNTREQKHNAVTLSSIADANKLNQTKRNGYNTKMKIKIIHGYRHAAAWQREATFVRLRLRRIFVELNFNIRVSLSFCQYRSSYLHAVIGWVNRIFKNKTKKYSEKVWIC